ncbi:MAG: CRISPR-associated endonuclease Cas1 [Verrucomicrobia bacterium]|nr:CRISPR-associated endonuclease Cas1 [Verrucomicrobiota bacterium]
MRSQLVVEAIGKKENLTATKEEIEAKYLEIVEQYKSQNVTLEQAQAAIPETAVVDEFLRQIQPDRLIDICQYLAQKFIEAAVFHILGNLKDQNVNGLQKIIREIEHLKNRIEKVQSVTKLMGFEAQIRRLYYSGWDHFLNWDEPFEKRSKQPPQNSLNALISFGNSLLYTVVLSEIYRTQLNPTISYLHEPGVRRHALLNQGAVLAEAEAFLVSVMGGSDLSLKEVDQLMAGIAKIGRAEALIMTGVCCESEWQDRLFVVFLVMEKKGADGLVFPVPQRDDEPGGGLLSAAPVEEPTAEPVSRGKIVQVGLFDKVSQGRFKDVEATVVEGKNLDIPTYKRRGIMIQKVLRNHAG